MTRPLVRQLAVGTAGVLAWALAWGWVIRREGVESPAAANYSLVALLGLVAIGVVSAWRQREQHWLVTIGTALLYATVFSVALVALTDSAGGEASCSPGEACDLDPGLGYVSGPLLVALPLLGFMAAARYVSASRAGHRSRHARPSRGGDGE